VAERRQVPEGMGSVDQKGHVGNVGAQAFVPAPSLSEHVHNQLRIATLDSDHIAGAVSATAKRGHGFDVLIAESPDCISRDIADRAGHPQDA
jgi:hypothetical protein